MVAGFVSDNPGTTQDDISDYVASNVKDTLSRLNGVGDVQLFGAQYAMRIWLDADLLNKYKLTPVDVINQLKVQNDQIAAGQLGGTPALPGQQLNASIIAQTRLKNPEEFGKVTLRVNSDGSVVRLKDVARVELGGENYNVIARINGKPAAGLGIKLATGANALDTAKAIKAKLAELQPFFPQGMKVLYPYDTAFYPGSGENAVRSHYPGIPGDVSVLAEHAGNIDTHHCCTCRVVRDICHTRRFWLLHQYANDVWDGTCHRTSC